MNPINNTKKTLILKILNKQYADDKIHDVRWPALLAALITFIVLICFNLLVPVMRSLPDEMGAVALAANLAGYDWSYVLTHPEMYYGSGTFFLTYPFFIFIKDPLILYQCLLGVAAFLHALTAYIACRILTKFYRNEFNNYTVVGLGVICALITPTRTSNIDNEPMLVLICWCIVYLIILLQHSDEKNKKVIYSLLLGGILGYSYLSHTRAIIYTFTVIIVIIIYYLFTKKVMVNIGSTLIAVFGSYTLMTFVVSKIRAQIFTNNEIAAEVIQNSPQSLMNSVVNSSNSIITWDGIVGFFDLLCSNLWVMFIFTGGLIAFVFYFAFAKTVIVLKDRIKDKVLMDGQDSYFPFIYCLLGYLITLFGLCTIWINVGMEVHTSNGNLSRGHFYLRYYGNFIAPLFLFTIIYLKNNKTLVTKKIIERVLLLLIVIVDYCLLSFVSRAAAIYTYNLDWFYYFAPFSFSFTRWPDCIQNLSYFLISTIIVTGCFILLTYFAKKNIQVMLFLLLIFLTWEYGYGVMMFDRPFSMSYYLASDSSYKLRKKDDFIFEGCDTLFYNNPIYGPGYVVQFMFPDKKVITDLTLINKADDNIILSSELLNSDIIDDSYSYIKLDENEYLYINSEERKNNLEKTGYQINNIYN